MYWPLSEKQRINTDSCKIKGSIEGNIGMIWPKSSSDTVEHAVNKF